MVILELRNFYQMVTLHMQYYLNHIKLFWETSWTDIMPSEPIKISLLQGGLKWPILLTSPKLQSF